MDTSVPTVPPGHKVQIQLSCGFLSFMAGTQVPNNLLKVAVLCKSWLSTGAPS